MIPYKQTSKAVLWDLDGTLVDSEPLHTEAAEAALGELGLGLPPGFHEDLLGVSEEGVHAALVERISLPLGRTAWREMKWHHYELLLAGLKPRATALTAIKQVTALGVPMAVVSNSTRSEVDLALAATKLSALFSVTISRNDVTLGKPDPEGYHMAAQRLGVSPTACLVVEDSITGSLAGLAAGMTTVFHPQHPGPGPEGALQLAPEGNLAELVLNWLEQDSGLTKR